MGQIPFNSTHQTNLGHTSFECGEIAGLKRTSCSMKQTVQVILDLSYFSPTIIRYWSIDPLRRKPLINGGVVLDYYMGRAF